MDDPILGYQVVQSPSLLAVVFKMHVLGMQAVVAMAASVFVHGIVPVALTNP